MGRYRLSNIENPFAAPVFYARSCQSTMELAATLAQRPFTHGAVLYTSFQRAGQGRLPQRAWHAPFGSALLCTIMLHAHQRAHMSTITLRTAAALFLFLKQTFNLTARIRWPNDILIHHKKICGILCKRDGDDIYCGIGLNCLQKRFPKTVRPHATSLLLEGIARSAAQPAQLLSVLLRNIMAVYTNTTWHQTVTENLWRIGETVEVTPLHREPFLAKIVGIAPDGALIYACNTKHKLLYAGSVREIP